MKVFWLQVLLNFHLTTSFLFRTSHRKIEGKSTVTARSRRGSSRKNRVKWCHKRQNGVLNIYNIYILHCRSVASSNIILYHHLKAESSTEFTTQPFDPINLLLNEHCSLNICYKIIRKKLSYSLTTNEIKRFRKCPSA